MLLNLFNVIYVLVAIAMLVLILLQRGAGAQAGSGFGSGASATVFGARGATTFLSRSTAVLAALFFLLSVLMGIYVHPVGPSESDLGVMGAADAPAAKTPVAPPAAKGDVPQAPPAATPDKPAPAAAPASKSDDGGHKADEPKKQ
jgi:preprotein translocase subunit SecG